MHGAGGVNTVVSGMCVVSVALALFEAMELRRELVEVIGTVGGSVSVFAVGLGVCVDVGVGEVFVVVAIFKRNSV